MKILDLTSLERSEIKYRIDKFPDGQQNVSITFGINPIIATPVVEIKARINNWNDLQVLVCAVASLRRLGIQVIHLFCPIILGSRSDRKFEKGGSNYMKDVISPIINSLGFSTVTSYDVHSYVSEACINNFDNMSNISLLRNFLTNWYPNRKFSNTTDKNGNIEMFGNKFILVSPDAGALHKVNKLAEEIGYKGNIITCTKERDAEGKLTKTYVPIDGRNLEKDVIIIDDICDGGRTFINIVNALKSYKEFKGKVYFVVSHMLHDTPNPELLSLFDGIYCTNSRHDKYYEKQGDHLVESKKIYVLNIF